jgi:hypothetical protein
MSVTKCYLRFMTFPSRGEIEIPMVWLEGYWKLSCYKTLLLLAGIKWIHSKDMPGSVVSPKCLPGAGTKRLSSELGIHHPTLTTEILRLLLFILRNSLGFSLGKCSGL